MAPRRPRRKNERGFALLLVFLMAALVAISLYMELPRVAMQKQRDKEQALIDCGEQYKRAIQLFVNKAKRYPSDIKELENFQNQRFLRHRYVDPMTGKDEWRPIHIQNGILTDSKVAKPQAPGGKEETKTPNGFVGEQTGLGANQNNTTQTGGAASVRDRRRASDTANSTITAPAPTTPVPTGGDLAGAQNPGVPPLPGQSTDGTQTGTNNPLPGQPGFPGQTGMPGMPGAFPGRGGTLPTTGSNNSSGSSSGSFVGGSGSFVGGGGSFVGGGTTGSTSNGSGTNTYPGQPGAPVNSQTGGVSPYPVTSGSNGTPPGFPQPGTSTGQSNSAADMIRNILTTPRPGGMPTANPGSQVFGGGIAGVATTAEGEGVKVYNDRSLYQEWEFIFDPAKQKQIPNPNASGLGGTPASQIGTPAGGTTGQQPGAPSSGQQPASRPFGQ